MKTNAELDMDIIRMERSRLFVLYDDLGETESKSWLVHGLFGSGEASAVYGAPGCGKSVLVEDMGLHIASGEPWHGRPVTRGAVVYIALERRKLVERRAKAFRAKHGMEGLPFAIAGRDLLDLRDPNTVTKIATICGQVETLTTGRASGMFWTANTTRHPEREVLADICSDPS